MRKNTGNYRARHLDYKKPGIFMITMNKLPDSPEFCKLVHHPEETIPEKMVRPDYLPLGYVVYYAFKDFNEKYKAIDIDQYIIMPEHLHFIVNVKETLDMELGKYLAILKRNIFDKASRKKILPENMNSVFETGFNDQFLSRKRSLDRLYRYLKKNPYNRWIRTQNPHFFRRIRNTEILGVECSLYGNLTLLDNPFMYPVIVHRADWGVPGLIEKKWEIWKYAVFNGGVLVGGFVSEEEKKVRDFAFEHGGKVIKMHNSCFEEKGKPSEMWLEQCQTGRILFISPNLDKELGFRRDFRQECVYLNSFAERMASTGVNPGFRGQKT